jgi:hypothetical protein
MSRRMRSKTTTGSAERPPLASAEEDATLAIAEGDTTLATLPETLLDDSGLGEAEAFGGLGEVLTV